MLDSLFNYLAARGDGRSLYPRDRVKLMRILRILKLVQLWPLLFKHLTYIRLGLWWITGFAEILDARA